MDGNIRRRLRLGMIGGGPGSFIGPVHRIAARLDGQFDLVAGAFSSDPARSRETGREAFLSPDRIYGDWSEMIRAEAARVEDRLDAITIATPNHLHHAQAKAALEAGFHVICDKPLTTTWRDAQDLAQVVARSGLVFGLTHNYSAYPMIRVARAMVGNGEIGRLRLVQVEYAQDWLATSLEKTGHRQAGWRTDPDRSGAGGALGDIGTHAYQLASFVTGELAEALCADLSSFGEGRQLDDNAHVLLRYASGMRGMLWASQVAVGQINGLRLRLFGDKGGLSWFQEEPNSLRFSPLGEPARIIERGGPGTAGLAAVRLPAGHPEGFLEAFAQLYTDLAEQIRAHAERRVADPAFCLAPGIADGCEGMRFVSGAVRSSREGGVWLSQPHWTG